MKSVVISAVFGIAILAIHGVTGARNGAFEVRSEALEETHSPAIERAASASTTRIAPDIPSANLPAGFSTTTCVHTTEGLIQCDDIITEREKPAAPSMDSLEKRAKKLPLRDGYPDRAGKCDKLHNLYHWAQTSNHPQYCHQLMDKNPPDQLWDWCYVLMVLDPTKHPLFILLVVEVFLRSALALKKPPQNADATAKAPLSISPIMPPNLFVMQSS
ncbi:hypothetical protein XANCAGTX0491_002781 [Xanthoria calcicola]